MKTRVLILIALGVLGSGACSKAPSPDVVDGGGGGCLTDRDCPNQANPDPSLFMCNKATAMCEPGCINKEDCSAARRGTHAIEACRTDLGGLGCECDEGRCVGSWCSSDAECGDRVCRNGACVTAPEASSVSRCVITPDLVVVKRDTTVKFSLLAWNAAEEPVVPKAQVQWTATSGGPLTGTGTGLSVELIATSEAGEAVLAVQAAVGSAVCQAKAIVLPPAPSGASDVAVEVIDELSSRPLVGLDVVLSKEDGSIVTQDGQSSVKTDGRGLAKLVLPQGLTRFSVTAFGPDHAYVTIANYSPSPDGGAPRYLSIVTRRNQSDTYGGVKGRFTGAPQSANAQMGMAGMSMGGALNTLSLGQLFGPTVKRDIPGQSGVALPSGVSVSIGSLKVKEGYSALGLAGVCTDAAGAPDEAAIARGTCGTLTAWSFAGDVPLNLLPIDAFLGGGTPDLDITQLLPALGPIVNSMTSSVVRDVRFSLRPTPRTDAGVPDFSDESSLTQVDHPFVQMPLAFPFVLTVPDLPKYRGAYAGSVLVFGGAKVPGRGFTPLGLGTAMNADGSAKVDAPSQGSLASGQIPLRMAPTHHGLEGSEYTILVAAMAGTSPNDASATPGGSWLSVPMPKNQLRFDPGGSNPVDLTAMHFLPYPEGAQFNFLDVENSQVPARSFRFSPMPDLGEVSVVRVSFADAFDRRWDVLMDPASAERGFTLPKPPAGSPDRLFSLDDPAGARSGMMVHTQHLRSGGIDLTFTDFVEVGNTNGDRLADLLVGFASLDYKRPTVEFTKPTPPAATVAKGSVLTLKVLRFKLGESSGADGVVRLTFAPDSGCPAALLSHETTLGNGVLEHSLPATCVGTDLLVKAELLKTDAVTPVTPPVSATMQLTVN